MNRRGIPSGMPRTGVSPRPRSGSPRTAASSGVPGGAHGGPLTATAGEPMPPTVWATDDGVARRPGAEADDPPPLVRLSLHLHQGPGEVAFADPEIEIAEGDPERVETTATFSEPGEYVLRVFANDRSGGGGSQCCWTMRSSG